jgi:hypothetical protein
MPGVQALVELALSSLVNGSSAAERTGQILATYRGGLSYDTETQKFPTSNRCLHDANIPARWKRAKDAGCITGQWPYAE